MGKKTKWEAIRVTETLRNKLEARVKKLPQFQSVASYAAYILNQELEKK